MSPFIVSFVYSILIISLQYMNKSMIGIKLGAGNHVYGKIFNR